MNSKKKLYVRLDSFLESRFFQIKKFLGLENETEVVRALINWYWRAHKEELPPTLEHYNLNPEGVMVADKEVNRIFQVYFHPDGVECECGAGNCSHVEFAMSLPKVQEILRKKGWKLRRKG